MTSAVIAAPLRIGTRRSPLALWQARYVAELLRPLAAPRTIELVQIQTAGDRFREAPLARIGADGVFTKEIQEALLTDVVDIAVHSLKDLPTAPVEGLMLAAVPARGPAGDACVTAQHVPFDELPLGAVVATSSLRRRAQILHRRPDLRVVDIRGNVETRLAKLHAGGLAAVILAQAGLERLGLSHLGAEPLALDWMLPAVGQGALGVECRVSDQSTRSLLQPLDHAVTRQAVLGERSMLRALGGGCLLPVGVVSRVNAQRLQIRAVVTSPDGKSQLEATGSGPWENAEQVGTCLAAQLIAAGADAILRQCNP